jgi:DNA-binding GntR family transcriptional regulator
MPRSIAAAAEKLSQRAYHSLRQRIVGGQLEPGQRLSLRKVAATLGMSMAPVGEALRELNRDGLVEMEPGWGARVRRLDVETLRNQHILRTALECEAARQCAERAAESQLDELTGLAEELDQRIDSHAEPAQVYELDSKFHLRIAQLSGAAVLFEGLRANQLVRMLARGSRIAHAMRRPPRQHLALVKALRSRDPQAAERAMREHCVRSMDLQLAHVSTSEMESYR